MVTCSSFAGHRFRWKRGGRAPLSHKIRLKNFPSIRSRKQQLPLCNNTNLRAANEKYEKRIIQTSKTTRTTPTTREERTEFGSFCHLFFYHPACFSFDTVTIFLVALWSFFQRCQLLSTRTRSKKVLFDGKDTRIRPFYQRCLPFFFKRERGIGIQQKQEQQR